VTDDTPDETVPDLGEEDAALQDALAAEHVAIWGHGVMGAALPPGSRAEVSAGDQAHRDVRDRLSALLEGRDLDPVPTAAAYSLPFPVSTAVDVARLGALLEDGVTAAWVAVLGRAATRTTRELALPVLVAAELRAVSWRGQAGLTPVTTAFPGL